MAYEDMGDQQLKNIDRPVKAYRLVSDADSSGNGGEVPEGVRRVSRFSRITGPETDEEVADLVAFLECLTDPASVDMSHLVPERVPSGLLVED